MWEQLQFSGFDLPGTDNVFFAVQPDEEGAGEVERRALDLCNEFGLKSRPIARRRFHVTLYGIGIGKGVPSEVVARAAEAAKLVEMPPFEVVFDRAMSFRRHSRKRPLVLVGRNDSLQALRRALEENLKRTGLGRGAGSSYTPHLTMLYDFGSVAERPVRPVGWIVSEFVLIHSLVGRGRYIRLGRWPLRG
jgi:2'-5' RNA ligase